MYNVHIYYMVYTTHTLNTLLGLHICVGWKNIYLIKVLIPSQFNYIYRKSTKQKDSLILNLVFVKTENIQYILYATI